MVNVDLPLPSCTHAQDMDAPSYSATLQAGEQILVSVPRSGNRHQTLPPTGKFERTLGNITVVLDSQLPCAELPTYGLNALVSGVIRFKKSKAITEVVIKVRGLYI